MVRQCEVISFGNMELARPCVDCGVLTGCYCDFCYAMDRLPSETWAPGQATPLCTSCDRKHDKCHFCREEELKRKRKMAPTDEKDASGEGVAAANEGDKVCVDDIEKDAGGEGVAAANEGDKEEAPATRLIPKCRSSDS